MATKKQAEEAKDMQAKTLGSPAAALLLDNYVRLAITNQTMTGEGLVDSQIATYRASVIAAGANAVNLDAYCNLRISQMVNPSVVTDATLAPLRTALVATINA